MTTARYPVVSHFYTVQGEGAFTGRPAYFIRLAGCDVGCPWCDTRESWSAESHPVVEVDRLLEAARAAQADTVVITGGEPAMHDLTPLTDALRLAALRVHLETSGAYPITGRFDWVTLSPKKYKPPVDSTYQVVSELKVVIANASDFDWAEQHRLLVPDRTRLMLQPEWNSPHMLRPIVDYVKNNPAWSISLQTHKYLNIP